jgi:hypothetical protein
MVKSFNTKVVQTARRSKILITTLVPSIAKRTLTARTLRVLAAVNRTKTTRYQISTKLWYLTKPKSRPVLSQANQVVSQL